MSSAVGLCIVGLGLLLERFRGLEVEKVLVCQRPGDMEHGDMDLCELEGHQFRRGHF